MNLSQREYFNNRVGEFDVPQPAAVLNRLKNIVSSAGLSGGEVVVDIGAGVGVLIPFLEAYSPSKIFACDLAEKMLERLKTKYPKVNIFHCDVAMLPLENGSVDVVFLNAMYGNISDKTLACQNVARMLKIGGRMIVSHPEGSDFVDKLRYTSPLQIESLPSYKQFQSILQPVGLKVTYFKDNPKTYIMVARKYQAGFESTKKIASNGISQEGNV